MFVRVKFMLVAVIESNLGVTASNLDAIASSFASISYLWTMLGIQQYSLNLTNSIHFQDYVSIIYLVIVGNYWLKLLEIRM